MSFTHFICACFLYSLLIARHTHTAAVTVNVAGLNIESSVTSTAASTALLLEQAHCFSLATTFAFSSKLPHCLELDSPFTPTAASAALLLEQAHCFSL